ncbi:hypothetical protein DOTSEDRAFT_171572 [Dothistroma septosporum NZE10]|uniref:Major facilitator superfamily (MFS) profile domain-containing protein n=1 Tax=Dothistroma septosporum (strain NZE10 / CBS 128990) TaxID=675120 RepID=N1PMX4_DOTSN|nr:hypothetical protein DOTSEDRAFT_171572 [Dothistroma septosporum NZE10]
MADFKKPTFDEDLPSDHLERTHTKKDVVHVTQELPYKEVNFIGTYFAILLACNASFCGFLMPVTSLTLIEAELGPSPNAVWVSLGWVLLSAVAFVLLGRLSDLFGRRWFFTGSTISGLIGGIIGATANHVNTLIAASVFLGLGSAGQLSFNICLGELVPLRHRFPANGIIFLSVLPFSGLGPYIARLLIVHTGGGFRSIYYLTLSLNAASTVLWILFYHPPRFDGLHRNRTVREELADLDFGGMFLFVAGVFLFLLGLAWGGTVHPWSSSYVLAPLIIGFFTTVGFVLYEILMPLERPLVPMHLFKNRDFVIINILSAVGGIVYYSANTLFPYMVAALYTTDVVEAGLVASCVGGGVCAGQFLGSWLAVPGGHFRVKLIAVSCGVCAFVAGLAGATDSQATGSALAVCAGLMVGILEVFVSTAVTIVIDDQSEIGLAAGVFGSIRAFAGVLATAIFSSVLTNKVSSYTTDVVAPALVKAGLPLTSVAPFLTALAAGNLPALEKVQGVTPANVAVGAADFRDAYAYAFKIGGNVFWLATIAFGGLAVIASFFFADLDDKLSKDVVRRLSGRSAPKPTDPEKVQTCRSVSVRECADPDCS